MISNKSLVLAIVLIAMAIHVDSQVRTTARATTTRRTTARGTTARPSSARPTTGRQVSTTRPFTCLRGNEAIMNSTLAQEFGHGFMQFFPLSVYTFNNYKLFCYNQNNQSITFQFDADASLVYDNATVNYGIDGTVVVENDLPKLATINFRLD